MVIEAIFGNKSAELALLHIYHYGESYASAIAEDFGLSSKTGILKQLDRFETAGILVSRLVGRTRLYMLNPKSPFTGPIKKILEIAYESIPLKERTEIFAKRRRPRQKGKPVYEAP